MKGDATAYGNGPVTSGATFSCPYGTLSAWQRVYYAAINAPQWNRARQCGRCIQARCVDARCKVKNKWVTVYVMDQCPECKYGDIDLSVNAFKELSGLSPDRVKVEWSWTSCQPYIQGNIRMDPKDRDYNEYWQALYLYNSVEPIVGVWINADALRLDTWGFWVHNGIFKKGKANNLTIKAESGATRSVMLTDIWKPLELPVQFSGV